MNWHLIMNKTKLHLRKNNKNTTYLTKYVNLSSPISTTPFRLQNFHNKRLVFLCPWQQIHGPLKGGASDKTKEKSKCSKASQRSWEETGSLPATRGQGGACEGCVFLLVACKDGWFGKKQRNMSFFAKTSWHFAHIFFVKKDG